MIFQKRARAAIVADLEERRQRLADIETNGAAALSKYDRTIAYGGDDEMAVRESMRLVSNHISYFELELAEHDKQPRQQRLL